MWSTNEAANPGWRANRAVPCSRDAVVTRPLRKFTRTLGFRFASLVAAVIAVIVALLTANSVRLLDRNLIGHQNERIADLRLLLNATLAPQLAANRIEPVLHTLRAVRNDGQILYFALLDPDQRVLALEGWPSATPLPPRVDRLDSLPDRDKSIDTFATLTDGERALGYVVFGLPSERLHAARLQMLWQSIAIGLIAIGVAALATWLVSKLVTRELRALHRAATAVGQGDIGTRLAVRRMDEIGELTLAFNRMIQALGDRMQALTKSEARFHAIADYTYGVEAWFSPGGRLIWINRSVERVTGYTAVECVLAGDLVELLVHPQDRRAAQEAIVGALQGQAAENFEMRLQRKDGSVIWAALNWQPILGPDGENLGLRVSGDDVSSRKQAEITLLNTVVELRREQALKEYYFKRSDEERFRLAALLDVLRLGILFVGKDNRIVYTNRAYRRMWGFSEEEELGGMRDSVLLDRKDGILVDGQAYRCQVEEASRSDDVSAPFEMALRDGRLLSGVSAAVSGPSPAVPIGRIWIFEDITEQRRVAEQLVHLAERDPLTGLYNRRRFHEELERNIAEAARRHTELGVLMMDLDGFKPINDEFGHHAGDEVLVTIAREVGGIVRRNEMFFRLGGDEFAVLMPEASEFEMVGLARRVANRIGELRFTFGGGQVCRLTASIGIALYPVHAPDGEQLVARADSAMYQAKAAGKNHWRIYRDPPCA